MIIVVISYIYICECTYELKILLWKLIILIRPLCWYLSLCYFFNLNYIKLKFNLEKILSKPVHNIFLFKQF